MKSDSYPRFIRSSAYQELLQAKKKVLVFCDLFEITLIYIVTWCHYFCWAQGIGHMVSKHTPWASLKPLHFIRVINLALFWFADHLLYFVFLCFTNFIRTFSCVSCYFFCMPWMSLHQKPDKGSFLSTCWSVRFAPPAS